ncbi:ANTAR domain-containing response regulator [Faecalicatena contorta]|uniref:Response regulator NasT n=1 Tax=Faecalicatena contorta TaxID=39482 RepID=A0A315ZQI5_9FIRM|nr:ANTAR domain-containing protein [Faecalicatena contorta]PWJ46924.1 response regulator NasT [Faecalicatena contorta]SUQ16252.1 response regulator NasT [Faecalicatena contorta]
MSSVIVVFPKRETSANIRNILVRDGIDVSGICTTGAQALQFADNFDDGIIICGYKMQDMLYSELREWLPESYEMLLVASPDKWSQGLVKGVVGLPMPVKVYDLLNTVEMMTQTMHRRRRKRREAAKNRNLEQKALIEQAKAVLMERNKMTEEEAHRYLQKSSMDSGTNMLETAQMILTIMLE